MRPCRGLILAGVAIAVLALLLIACEEKKEQVAKPIDVSQAAFVPNADFVARVDLEAVRNTPACKDFAKDNNTAKETSTEAEKAISTTDQFEEIQKITGLTAEDIASVLVTADLDTLYIGGEGVEPNISKANSVLALQLSKPLPNAKLVEAAKAVAAKDKNASAEEIHVAGQTAVRLSTEDEDDPDLFLTSGPGEQIVFMAPSTVSLEGALKRANSGEFSTVPTGLETVRGTLPATAQFKLAFLVSPKVRGEARQQLEKAKKIPEAMGFVGIAEPFIDLQSLAVGVECGDELKVDIGSDLGNPEAANQVAAMLQTMVLPMATGAIAKWTGKEPRESGNRFEIKAEGRALKIGVRLTQEEIAAMRKSGE